MNNSKSTNKIWQLLKELSNKSGLSEIIINGLDNIYVEVDGELKQIEYQLSEKDVDEFVLEVAKSNRRPFDGAHPILDGNLPDGSRINVIAKDYTKTCHVITIRKYVKNIKTFENNPEVFDLGPDWVSFFKAMVSAKMNVIVSGGTGVGKTTFLNLLLQEVHPRERVITIEDTRELQFDFPNVVRLEARNFSYENMTPLTQRDLLKNTLRMRPDRIIVGEVRGAEVFDLMQAMNTGHDGSMCSIHANSPGECLIRLENLFMLCGFEIPLKALRFQLVSAIDYIVQIKRTREGKRVVSQVVEISSMEGDKITMQDIGATKNNKFSFTGFVPSNVSALNEAGLPKDFFSKIKLN
jgi:pilus assembly protein CpaF